MKFHPIFSTALIVVTGALLFASCSTSPSSGDDSNNPSDSVAVTDKGLLKFQGEIFSIPSPVQTAILIQKTNAQFDGSVLNSLENVSKYATENKKALNLGVYGADLAYLSNFKNPQQSQKYFEVMGKLAQSLNILENIDQSLLQRFIENMNEPDSLLALNADFYKEGDRYLKNNDRQQVAAMILMGGWIEALHIACFAATNNEGIRSKIGEQRTALTSLIKVFKNFQDEETQKLNAALEALSTEMDKLNSTYAFNKPITDQDTRTTYITSKTTIDVSNEQLVEIKAKVNEIRNLITQ